jgi:hypothetical protein
MIFTKPAELILENLQVITHCLYESKIRRGQKEGPGSWLHMREQVWKERDKCDELRRRIKELER